MKGSEVSAMRKEALLGGSGGLVSKSMTGIMGVIVWLVRVINLHTKSP